MTSIQATVAGVDQLGSSLVAAGGRLADIRVVNQDAGELVVAGADVPKLTGRLESTVRATADGDGVTITAGGTLAPYAPIVHARDPFLTRSLDAQVEAIADRYHDHAAGVVDDIKGV